MMARNSWFWREPFQYMMLSLALLFSMFILLAFAFALHNGFLSIISIAGIILAGIAFNDAGKRKFEYEWKCPKCGYTSSETRYKYCPKCGTRMAEINKDWKYCSNCGTRLKEVIK